MKKLSVFLSLLFVSAAFSSFAEELKTEAIKVTATRVEKELQEVPYTVNVITEEQIRKSGATTIAELLRDLPGVELTTNAIVGMQRLSLRGENSFRTLILVDGMKITEQKSMEGTPILVDVNNIERIEIIQGPGSVLYGSEAIGGAINIITKKGGDRPLQGYVSGTYDTNSDGWSTFGSLNGSVNNFYYRADLSKTEFGERKDSHGNKLANTDYETQNIGLLAGYKNKKFDLGVQYTKYESELGVYISPDVITSPITNFFLDLPEWNRERYAAYFEYRNPGSFLNKARVDVFHQETYKDFLQLMTLQPAPVMTIDRTMSTENTLDTTGVLTQFNFELSDTNLLIAGIEFNVDDLDATTDTIQSTTSPMGTTTTRTIVDAEAKQTTFAAFLHDEQTIGENWILGAGLRYSRIENELTSTNDPNIPTKDTDFDSFVGTLSAVFTGVKDTAFRALYSSGYRAPNLQELYMGTSHGGTTTTLSNPDLDPEKSNSYELGVRYSTNKTDVDFAVFYSDAEDYITTQEIDTDIQQYTNVDEAKTMGAEVSAKAYAGDFTPYITGAYVRRKYEFENLSTYKTNTPAITSRVGLLYDKQISQKFLIGTDVYARYSDKAEQLIRSTGVVEKTDSYTTLNLAVTGTYYYKDDRRFMVGVEALNIGDENYEVAKVGVPEAGRHFIFKVSADF